MIFGHQPILHILSPIRRLPVEHRTRIDGSLGQGALAFRPEDLESFRRPLFTICGGFPQRDVRLFLIFG